MGNNRQISPAEEPLIIYVDTALKHMQHRSHSLSVGYTWWLAFREDSTERGKQEHCSYLTNNDKNSVKQSRWTSTVISPIDSRYPCCDVVRMAFNLCGLLPKNHNSRIIMRKISDKSQLLTEGCSMKYQISIPQNCQDCRKEKFQTIIAKRSLKRNEN